MIIENKEIKLWDSEVTVNGTYIAAESTLYHDKYDMLVRENNESEFIVRSIYIGKLNIFNCFSKEELNEVSEIIIKEIECT